MKTNTVVYTVGRFQPLTLGHEKLAKAVASNAKKENGDAVLYTTASYDPVNNPLKYSQKTFWLKKAFSKFVKVSTNKNSTNPFTAAEELAKTYDHLILIVGADRTAELQRMETWFAREYGDQGKTFEVRSAGKRSDLRVGTEDVSGSFMRKYTNADNFEMFYTALPSTLSKTDGRKLFIQVRTGMGLKKGEIR